MREGYEAEKHSTMKHTLTLLTALLLALLAAVCANPPADRAAEKAAPEIRRLTPLDDETIYTPNPHFEWARLPDARLDDRHQIQIATDASFATIVREDSLEVVSRYVCAEPLLAGTYYWRVRRQDGPWPSQASRFAIAESKVYPVPAGATSSQIKRVISTAAANTPAKVLFPPGRHLISDRITLTRAKDLIIDGGGSTLVIAETSFQFVFCKNITLQNMMVEPETDPSTHLDILAVSQEKKTVTVRAKPGFPQDVSRYFTPGSGACILRCVDVKSPGKAIRSAAISNQDAGAAISGPDPDGNYTFHQVKNTALNAIRPGMTAYVIKYAYGLVRASFTEKLTLSHVTLLGTGGATVFGIDNSAQSYLSCKFLPLTENHYTGAQGIIGFGRTGMWFENCEFKYAVDDNMAVQTLKMSLESMDTNDIAVLANSPWNHEIQAGDEVLLWHVASNTTAIVKVLESLDANGLPVSTGELMDRRPKKMRLSKSAAKLNAKLGRDASASFAGVLLFRYSPNNQDFVFRKNRILGGSAGCMYNGMRGWIADNTFTNCRGAAIRPGYHSPNEASGYGARDVLVRGNTMVNCGGTGVEIHSTANVGGNIILKQNRIVHRAIENGFFIASVLVNNNCDNIVVKDNVFESDKAPERGSWIFSRANHHWVQQQGNKSVSPFTVPMLRQERVSGK